MKTVAALFLASLAALAAPVQAAEWPAKSVRVIVPFAPGGQSDVVARILAQSLDEKFHQQFYIENQSGGGTVIGTRATARAEPDGYTLMIGGMATHVLSPAMNKDVGFDPIGDFTHIAYLGGSPTAFVMHPSAGVKDFDQFVTAAKKPEGVQYVSPGVGSGSHSVAELFASKSGVKLLHVPYRGGNSAVADLIAGHVKMGSLTWSTAREYVASGTLIPIAISSDERLPAFPQIPTFKEKGYPDVTTTIWLSVSGPKGMPADIVRKLNVAVNAALDEPRIRKHLDNDAFDKRLLSPEQTTALFKAEYDKWTPAIHAAMAGKD